MILTSAERNDSGTYTLNIYDVDGRSKGSYTLQVNIEAQVSSVKVSYSCLSSGVMKVTCSADGDNLHFSWTSDFNTLPQLENGTSTVTLEQDHQGNITCHVENHVSRDHDTAELHQCPGSQFQDHVCRFNQIKPCYVAVGQRLYLQMPLEDGLDLNTPSLNLPYIKTQSSPPTPRLAIWQFVNDNKTIILTSAERNDSGTYTLNIFDGYGRSKGSYTLQVNIEAQVSSVKVSYSCLSSGVMKVTCSADGDNLHFSWTSDFNTLPQLENGTSTVTLEQDHQGNITCHVENHVSRDHDTAELHQCPGSLFQDHDLCRFTQRNPCHVAVGQRLHLQMPWEDGFDLQTTSLILRYRKTQSSPPTPRLPRWQFVNDNKTMILTSAERSDSGTYTLNIFDVDGRSKGSYTLQVNIEAQVSSVKVSYSCLFSEVWKVFCSAVGDNLHFSWTSDFNTLPQLENGTSTVTLEQDHQGNITCHVENHVSRDHDTAELHQCPGSLFQDHVVCRFNQIKPCYVAVGQRLHLQMPLEDGFDLKTTSLILRYRKTQNSSSTPRLPRWQFVNDNKTMILTSAERNDSGTYTLNIYDVDGRSKGSYTLQVNIEAQVSSVNVSYSCLFSGVMKVTCSADGDNLHFSWTSDFNTLPQLENGTSTVTLEQDHQGNITCHVENHVSRHHDTAELHQCPGSLFQDHDVCRFNQIKACYVAVGQRLHLQMPLEDGFDLKTTTSLILKYRKTQSSPPTPRLPRWQFVSDNKTMILTSAERNDSGTYTLNIFDVDGRSKGSYTLQVNIEAQVSSVKLSYSCLFSGVRRVFCSADGDNLHFSWTSESITRLEDDNKTLVLDKSHREKFTCLVENHISREHNSINLPTCIDFMIVFVWLFEVIILLSVLVGTLYIYPRISRKQRTPERPGSSVTLNKD
ncbi:carcinoembryonic antigen-related cell adhesion molecule 5-like isoform X3 [Tachysurus fulvidraco]|uniref:carcinoembryonic antigen-related cell adhesion molecule 5-like isoform X3 n=1 Tax=Tachysurus fulvidraco TaxID=1234273 RepID=UPI001FF0253F|nr:carcinoembryonic antigen-related cell adhesion molecule 5-like isoform X3 [Tachysurus fulvidraco]